MFNVCECALRTAYDALPSKDQDCLYLIKDTKEIFLGSNPYGVSAEILDTTLPASGKKNILYVIKSGEKKGIHTWNGTAFDKTFDLGDFVTADSTTEFKNKTIDMSKSNTVKNAELNIFKSGVVKNTIAQDATDEQLLSAKAVYNALKVERI